MPDTCRQRIRRSTTNPAVGGALAVMLLFTGCTQAANPAPTYNDSAAASNRTIDVADVIAQVVGQGDFVDVNSPYSVADLANAIDPSWGVTDDDVAYYEDAFCSSNDLQPIYDFVIDYLPGADEQVIPLMNKMVGEAAAMCGEDPFQAQAALAIDIGRATLPETASTAGINLAKTEQAVCHAISVAGDVTQAGELLDLVRGTTMTRLAALISIMNDVCTFIENPLVGFLKRMWHTLTA